MALHLRKTWHFCFQCKLNIIFPISNFPWHCLLYKLLRVMSTEIYDGAYPFHATELCFVVASKRLWLQHFKHCSLETCRVKHHYDRFGQNGHLGITGRVSSSSCLFFQSACICKDYKIQFSHTQTFGCYKLNFSKNLV